MVVTYLTWCSPTVVSPSGLQLATPQDSFTAGSLGERLRGGTVASSPLMWYGKRTTYVAKLHWILVGRARGILAECDVG